ncbi:hypothetical protein C8J56DRAFT_981850 [Mycena floridula]|nr:hypothetical protein C8J56DRAFT_981850 [Mycena floridula]
MAISFSVPDAIVIGASLTFTWQAGPLDPEEFTLAIGKNALDINKIGNVNRTGQTNGSATTPPLTFPGIYYVAALVLNTVVPLGQSKGIRVGNPPDSSAPVSLLSSNMHQLVMLHCIALLQLMIKNQSDNLYCHLQGHQPLCRTTLVFICFPLKNISSDSSITASRPSQNHGSVGSITDSALVTGSGSSGQVMQTDSYGLTTINSIHPSIVTTNQSPTNLPLSTMSHTMPGRVRLIVGGTFGVVVILVMTMGLLVVRHRRSRLLKIPVSPYELSDSEDTGAQSPMPRTVLNWQERHLQIKSPADLTGNGATITSEKAEITSEKATIAPEPEPFEEALQTERQRSLQALAVEMERQLVDSEAAFNNMTEVSPELGRALITENIQLKAENQVLRDLNHSDWALGLTDVPPPSYPHSETSSI